MIVDTSGLIASFNHKEPSHHAVVAAIEESQDLILSPYVVAEVNYLVATRFGLDAELEVLDELSRGAWTLADFNEATFEMPERWWLGTGTSRSGWRTLL